jgi:hypothetical protein
MYILVFAPLFTAYYLLSPASENFRVTMRRRVKGMAA